MGFAVVALTSACELAAQPGWTAAGIPFRTEQVRGMAVDTIADALYYCGESSIDGDNSFTDQGVSVYHNGQWDTLSVFQGAPSCVARWHDTLLVGGYFYNVNGDTSISQLAGTDSSGWFAYGAFDNHVEDLKVIDGVLYAIGSFNVVDGDTCNGIARRVGGHWEAVGAFDVVPTAWIVDLLEWRDTLYITGSISFNGTTAHHVAWLDGAVWKPLGTGIVGGFGFGRSLCIYQDNLYVGGSIYLGQGNIGHGIIRWDGTQFHPVGTGVFGSCGTPNCAAGVTDMLAHNGLLFASGAFFYAGGEPTTHIATWDGTQWCGMPGELQGPVDNIEFFHDTLFAAPNEDAEGIDVWSGAKFIDTTYFSTCSGPMVLSSTIPPPEHLQAWWSTSNSLSVSGLPDGMQHVQLFDAMGRLVLVAKVTATSDAPAELAVPDVAPGVYFVRVAGVGSVAVGRAP